LRNLDDLVGIFVTGGISGVSGAPREAPAEKRQVVIHAP